MTIREAIENNYKAKRLYDEQREICNRLDTHTQWERLTKYRNEWEQATLMYNQLTTIKYNGE